MDSKYIMATLIKELLTTYFLINFVVLVEACVKFLELHHTSQISPK